MQEDHKDLTESVSIKTELRQNGKGPEAVFVRTKNTRARLLRRSSSQSLLLSENKKEDGFGRSRQDSTLSSRSSGLLFARPLSSASREQSKPSLFPRPKSSLMSATSVPRRASDSDRLTRRAKAPPGKASVPTLVRRSSYFSLQSLRRALSVDTASSKRLTKRGSRDEKDGGRFGLGFKGIVTAIDEEEREEQRQLVRFFCTSLCCFQSKKKISRFTLILNVTLD